VDHPFINAFQAVYGQPYRVESKDILSWYLEEFLVAYTVEATVFNSPDAVMRLLVAKDPRLARYAGQIQSTVDRVIDIMQRQQIIDLDIEDFEHVSIEFEIVRQMRAIVAQIDIASIEQLMRFHDKLDEILRTSSGTIHKEELQFVQAKVVGQINTLRRSRSGRALRETPNLAQLPARIWERAIDIDIRNFNALARTLNLIHCLKY